MANKSEARWKKEGRMAMPAVEPFFAQKSQLWVWVLLPIKENVSKYH